jgi:hypothetical protein
LPARSSTRRRAVATLAATEKHHGPDDPRVADARRDLKAAEAYEHAEHVRRIVDTFPPLTAEQRSKIAALLRPAVASPEGRTAQAGGDAA